MDKLTIFPALYKNREIARYSHLLDNYILISAVTAAAPTPEIESAYRSYAVHLTDNFEDGIRESNVVFFMDGLSNDSITLYFEYISIALQMEKKVLLNRKLHASLKEYGGDFPTAEVLSEDTATVLRDDLAYREKYLKRIDVPVIAVMGLGDYCGKFSCELALRDYFKQYDLLQYGSKDIGRLFGLSELPDFIYDQHTPLTDRILKLNHYLYHQCVREKPDLMIIGLPEAIVPNNRKILNNFGEISFIISQALLNIDIGIMCIYFGGNFSAEYLEEYRRCCKYKLNCAADYFNIANTAISYDEVSNESKLQYMFFSNEVVQEHFPIVDNSDICIFGMESDVNIQDMLDKICDELTSSPNVF